MTIIVPTDLTGRTPRKGELAGKTDKELFDLHHEIQHYLDRAHHAPLARRNLKEWLFQTALEEDSRLPEFT